jgi:hypothetical protein
MRIRVLCSAVTWLQLLYFGKHLDGGGGSLLLSFESPIELFRRNYARGYSSSSGSPVQPAPGLRRDIPAVMEWQPSLPTEECLFWLRSCTFLLNQDCVPIGIPHLSAFLNPSWPSDSESRQKIQSSLLLPSIFQQQPGLRSDQLGLTVSDIVGLLVAGSGCSSRAARIEAIQHPDRCRLEPQ